jgi:hypothetical protein
LLRLLGQKRKTKFFVTPAKAGVHCAAGLNAGFAGIRCAAMDTRLRGYDGVESRG